MRVSSQVRRLVCARSLGPNQLTTACTALDLSSVIANRTFKIRITGGQVLSSMPSMPLRRRPTRPVDPLQALFGHPLLVASERQLSRREFEPDRWPRGQPIIGRSHCDSVPSQCFEAFRRSVGLISDCPSTTVQVEYDRRRKVRIWPVDIERERLLTGPSVNNVLFDVHASHFSNRLPIHSRVRKWRRRP